MKEYRYYIQYSILSLGVQIYTGTMDVHRTKEIEDTTDVDEIRHLIGESMEKKYGDKYTPGDLNSNEIVEGFDVLIFSFSKYANKKEQ